MLLHCQKLKCHLFLEKQKKKNVPEKTQVWVCPSLILYRDFVSILVFFSFSLKSKKKFLYKNRSLFVRFNSPTPNIFKRRKPVFRSPVHEKRTHTHTFIKYTLTNTHKLKLPISLIHSLSLSLCHTHTHAQAL